MLKKRFFKTKDECEVSFELPADEANQIDLVCEANGWQPIQMKKAKGKFRTRIRLPKQQRFQFRYLVDQSSWINDDAADAYLRNKFGSENGIVVTTPTT